MLTSSQLQEEVHAASLRLSEQELEIKRLKQELAMRPKDPNARVVELQDELDQYKLIAGEFPLMRTVSYGAYLLTSGADDYERHLAEPTRKVREDVEKEYAPKIARLESALESKRIWANRLDENIRAVTVENKDLQQVGSQSLRFCRNP
jgi:centromeric protein E